MSIKCFSINREKEPSNGLFSCTLLPWSLLCSKHSSDVALLLHVYVLQTITLHNILFTEGLQLTLVLILNITSIRKS